MKKLICFLTTLFALTMTYAQIVHATSLALVENQVQVGKMMINLPAGQWRVLNSSDARTAIDNGSQGGQVERKYLIQLNEKNQFFAAIFLSATKYSTNVDRWNDSVCERKDTLWIQPLDGNFKFPACLLIGHVFGFWTSVPNNDFDRVMFDWYKQHKVELPKTALLSSYRKYFSGDFIVASYFINPELVGFAPDSGTTWGSSQWHAGVIKEDAAKVKYVEALKTWSQAIEPSHRNSLMKGTPIGGQLSALPNSK